MTKENSIKGEGAMFVEREENGSSVVDASATPAACATRSPSGTSDVSQYPVHSLPIEGCFYRGEGNANLVIALPSERKVIRLRKSAAGEESSPEEEDLLRVRREVDFIKLVISGFLGCYVRAPEILRCDQPEIARLSEKIRPARPESRRSKDIVAGYATKFPDYTFLPENLSNSRSIPTYCVEIKPKQGFICEADRQFQKCSYCLTQYYKIRNGSAKSASTYCPLDLFSGETDRIKRAIASLLRSPQNNLKIFREGSVVYDDNVATEDSIARVLEDWLGVDPLEVFLELTCNALTRPFDADGEDRLARTESEFREIEVTRVDFPSRLEPELVRRAKEVIAGDGKECEPSDETWRRLVRGSVLERILRMQRLHQCGADAVAWIHANFPTPLTDELIYANVVRTGDTALLRAEINLETEDIKKYRKNQQYYGIVQNGILKNDVYEKNNNEQKNSVTTEKFWETFTVEECIAILKNYLLFCTAKDCSILMAFQEVDKKLSSNINPTHRIDISKDRSFLVNVRVLDLDMKSLKCIEKHCHRDNDVLQATIEALERKLDL